MWKFLNEANIDSVLLAAIEQFKDRATDRVLIAELGKCKDSGTTQEDIKKTSAKMLLSTLYN